jgi:hypothetical protein
MKTASPMNPMDVMLSESEASAFSDAERSRFFGYASE